MNKKAIKYERTWAMPGSELHRHLTNGDQAAAAKSYKETNQRHKDLMKAIDTADEAREAAALATAAAAEVCRELRVIADKYPVNIVFEAENKTVALTDAESAIYLASPTPLGDNSAALELHLAKTRENSPPTAVNVCIDFSTMTVKEIQP